MAFMETARACGTRPAARDGLASVVYAFGGWDAILDEAALGGACIAEKVTMGEAVRACAEACAMARLNGWPRGCPVIVDAEGRRIAPGLS